ncbi:exported hypothetical protein [Hyphomicrobium sp. GJ21]|uniref:hypothetical protein n=1 Tax=Hyphomicrobium sp. GJ21 TaxID=113574 RepID=UPI000622BF8B|nr:hypothetical protein [Hyphomicrobium sp. GJ21]CEJ84836.1 exported hypothetical protein [Hyphomicrobium sp. GJ21]
MDVASTLTILLSIFAIVLSGFALLESRKSNRAALFDQRFAVYRDVEKFLGFWARDGRPNLGELRLVIDAWNRSHFLFDGFVTAYLRQLWLDAVQAESDARTVNGEQPGDRNVAIEREQQLFLKYCGEDNSLRTAFMRDLKI